MSETLSSNFCPVSRLWQARVVESLQARDNRESADNEAIKNFRAQVNELNCQLQTIRKENKAAR